MFLRGVRKIGTIFVQLGTIGVILRLGFVVPTASSSSERLFFCRRLEVDRVLTSGRAESAWDGRDTIARLVGAGRRRIVVMPGPFVQRNAF